MTATGENISTFGDGWRKLAVLVLALVIVGLPINSIGGYALALIATLVIFTGEVNAGPRTWMTAAVIVAMTAAAQLLLAPPRFNEGHNVFLPDAKVLHQGLPADVYGQMAREFDALYPSSVRCKPGGSFCWQDLGRPDRLYAFSGDGIWHKTSASRAVTSLGFSDPVWLRLGFINQLKYNWYTTAPDVHRNDRDRRFWMGLKRWHLAMPWFEMVRLPAAYAGGEMCWRGEIMWEGAGGHFARLPGGGCRAITAADAGRRVFGLAIAPDSLAMQLRAPWPAWIEIFLSALLTIAGVAAAIMLLVRVRPRRLILPAVLIALAVIVIAIDDASFLGGIRPFDGGDDGLFYEGAGRLITQHILAGDIMNALRGNEDVFFDGLPGLRYLRALELFVFGDSNFGYLSLMLALPVAAYALFRRFLSARWAVAIAIVFVAVPVGAVFGSSYFHYVKWATRGFADPAAAALLLIGLVMLLGRTSQGPGPRFVPAFGAAFVIFLAVFVRPNLAPFVAVMLGGAGVAALAQAQMFRLAGLYLGFLPVVTMAIHNWYFGHVFVLFGANSTWSGNLPTPPAIYLSALGELVRLNLSGEDIAHVIVQLAGWLAGPAESYWTIPINAAAILIVVVVLVRGRGYDSWLRLLAGATLAGHMIALFYRPSQRYYYVTWLMTCLVCTVWVQTEGVALLRKKFPTLGDWLAKQPGWQPVARALTWVTAAAG